MMIIQWLYQTIFLLISFKKKLMSFVYFVVLFNCVKNYFDIVCTTLIKKSYFVLNELLGNGIKLTVS